MAQYGLFVLKVPLNPNQSTNHIALNRCMFKAYILTFIS